MLTRGFYATGGYIVKEFEMQEREANGQREKWEPIIRGVVKVHDPLKKSGSRAEAKTTKRAEHSYQPFVFLVSYKPKGPIEDFWFSYYKDTRNEKGGRLKMGHGPGGPPVLKKEAFLDIVKHLVLLKLINKNEIKELMEAAVLNEPKNHESRSATLA